MLSWFFSVGPIIQYVVQILDGPLEDHKISWVSKCERLKTSQKRIHSNVGDAPCVLQTNEYLEKSIEPMVQWRSCFILFLMININCLILKTGVWQPEYVCFASRLQTLMLSREWAGSFESHSLRHSVFDKEELRVVAFWCHFWWPIPTLDVLALNCSYRAFFQSFLSQIFVLLVHGGNRHRSWNEGPTSSLPGCVFHCQGCPIIPPNFLNFGLPAQIF